MKSMLRKFILVKGLVQGVGFRPFVYKIAVENRLRGYVKNSSAGVIIDVEGSKEDLEKFILKLKSKAPKYSRIDEIIIKDQETCNYLDFQIGESIPVDNEFTYISPDLGICEACYEDINNKESNRYRYAFTNCTNCGPRYSIIKSIPYQRSVTTMEDFNLCGLCEEEYKNVFSRRFNAESNCCPKCGPELKLVDNEGNRIYCDDLIRKSIQLINDGKILSIKGIGGFNLVCNGKNNRVIDKLRERKHRKTKPFAVMIKDVQTVKKYCYLSIEEEQVLTSDKKPIVILRKRENTLPDSIAPGSVTLGVMLPYTPLHYLLFDQGVEVLIMTSGNINGIPIIYKNIEAISKLSEIADYHLINNRDIYTSVDDSVTRVILGHERVIRRGRGYAPTYFKGNKFKESISLGAHLKNSFCLCKDEKIVLSQYIGDLQNEETINRYESALKSLCSIYNVKPQLIAYDMHPNIFSSHFFNRFEGKRIGVYHHHAHIASVLFENNVENRVIGVAYDGTGYGIDGTIWGGEFLLADFKEFKRAAHLSLVKMPGGDMAAREPIRMITSYLCEIYKDRTEEILMGVLDKLRYDGNMLKEFMNIRMYMDMINKNINSPRTSSMGRLFDAVAYLLGFNQKVTFEGEAALYIENIANGCNSGSYDFEVKTGEEYVINTDRIIISIIKDLRNGVSKDVISKKFHNTIIKFTVDMCVRIWEDSGIKEVALSGGVFQNKILLEGIYNKLTARGFRVYTNKQIPCNDGGISIGQIAIANNREME